MSGLCYRFLREEILILVNIFFSVSSNLREELGVMFSERMTFVGMKMCLEETDSDFLTPSQSSSLNYK